MVRLMPARRVLFNRENMNQFKQAQLLTAQERPRLAMKMVAAPCGVVA
ncbi:hypothetical protein ASR47_102414 [Janthinobacterium psychrotolerans]|uniref:Uncharacterized protein n=1 Tax=Janthinobacterium psychrotolerans TaxID=1747903 RepID=A0A1A7C7T8_9BURK|nr:hypothetical protein ASR47_102414 [Janthinobacterium psychrotolerans]